MRLKKSCKYFFIGSNPGSDNFQQKGIIYSAKGKGSMIGTRQCTTAILAYLVWFGLRFAKAICHKYEIAGE